MPSSTPNSNPPRWAMMRRWAPAAGTTLVSWELVWKAMAPASSPSFQVYESLRCARAALGMVAASTMAVIATGCRKNVIEWSPERALGVSRRKEQTAGSDQLQPAADTGKGGQRLVQVLAGVPGRDLATPAGLSLRHDREAEPGHENAFLEKEFAHPDRRCGFAQNDRH